MVTLQNVAQAAGVSRGTVDRVLHGRGSVKPEVALRVKAMARELGYVKDRVSGGIHESADALRVGVLLPGVGNPFFDLITDGMLKAQTEFGAGSISLCLRKILGFDEDEHLAVISDLEAQDCKVLCLNTINTPKLKERINALSESGKAVVMLDSVVEGAKHYCYVGSDYLCSGRASAGMLALTAGPVQLKILIVTGSRLFLGHNLRISGFEAELKRRGVPYEVAGIIESCDSDIIAQQRTAEALAERRDINCVYVTGAGIQGVGAALIASGRKDIIASAFDEVYTTQELVRAGILRFVVCQEPVLQGYLAVKRAWQAASGLPSPGDYVTETIVKISSSFE